MTMGLRGVVSLLMLMMLTGCTRSPSRLPHQPQPASRNVKRSHWSLRHEPAGRSVNQRDFTLFSWQQNGEWYFALLPYDRRMQALKQIASPELSDRGTRGLSRRMTSLRIGKGDWIGWSNSVNGTEHLAGTAFPPPKVMSIVCSDVMGRGAFPIVEQVLGE